ncbi:hypothetical protein FQR65_LT04985 [Abscondita terminalis]|nr:hypothetical protein FQR65_LT04985 [Abscondita terminalis]
MSKRASLGQTNTLFNYFQSPKAEKRKATNGIDNLKTPDKDSEANESDEEVKPVTKKRQRLAIVDSDSSDNESLPTTPAPQKRPKLSRDESAVDFNTSKNVSPFETPENWLHERLDFLKPDRIRDIDKNRPGDPNYDEKTLHVPEEFLNKQTPAMRQWWVLKSRHYDTVLFFKVGKFYEFYHMDAVVGVNNLGFSYMKGDFAHSGFPESAYGRMASSLIEQGFKVARVEQTETPEMMAERCKNKKATKFEKVVNREICQISTQATCIYGAQMTDAKQPMSCYLIAIAESVEHGTSKFGVCFVDTSVGLFHLGQFEDDRHCSRLLGLFAQHPPSLILIEKGRMQPTTLELLKKSMGNVKRDALTPKKQFLDAQSTLDTLSEGCYFRDKDEEFRWPEVLCDLVEHGNPKPEYELAVKALGACLWYLKDSELDIYMLSMKKFEIYRPVDCGDKETAKRDFMVLDHVTIQNLSLMGGRGCLQHTLDYCSTPFGKRLLQQWICRPLCKHERIAERQNAVAELYENNELRQAARAILKKLPDLERQVSKLQLVFINETHTTPDDGLFLDISETLQFFREAFDQKQAETDGKIIPQPGVDDEFDESEKEVAEVQREAADYLDELKKMFGCNLTYFGTDKKRFQIEIPEAKTRKVTSEFQLEGSRKGAKPCNRYSTPTSRQILADMIKAETKRNKIVQDLNRRVFEKFSDSRAKWEQVIQCLMTLDVLCSFAEYARNGPQNICFPKVLPFANDAAFIEINDGVHPCVNLDDFVPNGTRLGVKDEAKLLLLTGPNMGGKSTLMRQVALILIMAQMGCPVPALKCEFTMVDRIFTRLGASDDILQGQSTFLVELNEASAILKHATSNSFALIDELGRGTSTHDGNAIATAYVKKLIGRRCRTIFSTHYHSLVEYYEGRTGIQLGHMACMAEDEQDNDDSIPSVTLLYQLKDGNCPKSYGFNVAKLAGIPMDIIKRAQQISIELERTTLLREKMAKLMSCKDPIVIRQILQSDY